MCFLNRDISTLIALLAICMSVSASIINTDRNCRPFDEYSPGLCQTNCYSNLDCASEDMCCSTGCGTGCVPRKLPPKPEYDPSCQLLHPNTGGICEHKCYSNSECGDKKICCSTGCGSACRTRPPVYDHRCQVLHHNTGGICVTECSRNGDCKYGEICCSNNCGGVCRPSSMTG